MAQPKWYGRMHCNSCAYQWQARRDTPPARCPRCGQGWIMPVMEKRGIGCFGMLILAVIVIIVLMAIANSGQR